MTRLILLFATGVAALPGIPEAGGSSGSTVTAGDKEAEFVYGVEQLRDIRADALFGNVYRDYPGAFGGLTPYVGAGVGLLGIRMAYDSAYHRNPRP